VLDDAGEIESAVTIIADVTDATPATQRVRFLARIGELRQDAHSQGIALAYIKQDAVCTEEPVRTRHFGQLIRQSRRQMRG